MSTYLALAREKIQHFDIISILLNWLPKPEGGSACKLDCTWLLLQHTHTAIRAEKY